MSRFGGVFALVCSFGLVSLPLIAQQPSVPAVLAAALTQQSQAWSITTGSSNVVVSLLKRLGCFRH